MKNEDILITSAFRTAIGSLNGSLSSHTAPELGSVVIKKCIENSKLKKEEVDMVYMGQVLTTGSGQNPARQASILAGLSNETTNTTVNQVCGSGLASVALAYNSLKSGDGKLIIAGGQESMSNSPHYINIRKDKKVHTTIFHFLMKTYVPRNLFLLVGPVTTINFRLRLKLKCLVCGRIGLNSRREYPRILI